MLSFLKKRKPEPQPDPEPGPISLEELLTRSAKEPGYRAEFYRRLLVDDIVALTAGPSFPPGEHVAAEATRIQLRALADGVIPIFTSTERIFDGGVIKEQVDTIQMKGEDLFKMTRGSRLVLNPYSGYGKEFVPEEVERMLDGTVMEPVHSQLKLEKDTQVLLGQPSVYPTEMVETLKRLFSTKPEVNAAYVGWIHNPASGEDPHYIFGVSLASASDIDAIMNAAGSAIQTFDKPGGFVDFIVIENSGLSDYFLQTEPFYSK